MGRCIPCWLSRIQVYADHLECIHPEDRGFVVRPRAPLRPGDMPSRADRNRLRRIAHVNQFGWLVVRGTGEA
jgi:hypothetical protein